MKLPDKYREVIHLYYYQELGIKRFPGFSRYRGDCEKQAVQGTEPAWWR